MSIVRLQFPDGTVPEDIYECAYGWKREYDSLKGRYDRLIRANAELQIRVDLASAGLKRHQKTADAAELACAIQTLTGEPR